MRPWMGSGVRGLGFRILGSGFGVRGLGFGILDPKPQTPDPFRSGNSPNGFTLVNARQRFSSANGSISSHKSTPGIGPKKQERSPAFLYNATKSEVASE